MSNKFVAVLVLLSVCSGQMYNGGPGPFRGNEHHAQKTYRHDYDGGHYQGQQPQQHWQAPVQGYVNRGRQPPQHSYAHRPQYNGPQPNMKPYQPQPTSYNKTNHTPYIPAPKPIFCDGGELRQFFPYYCDRWVPAGSSCPVQCGKDEDHDPFVCPHWGECFAFCKPDGSWDVPCACNVETLKTRVQGASFDDDDYIPCESGEVCTDIECQDGLKVSQSIRCDEKIGFAGECVCEPLDGDIYKDVQNEDHLCSGKRIGEICNPSEFCAPGAEAEGELVCTPNGFAFVGSDQTIPTRKQHPQFPLCCDPSTTNLLDFKIWQLEKAYWVGQLTFHNTGNGNFLYKPEPIEKNDGSGQKEPLARNLRDYYGFIRLDIQGNMLRQKNIFVYPGLDLGLFDCGDGPGFTVTKADLLNAGFESPCDYAVDTSTGMATAANCDAGQNTNDIPVPNGVTFEYMKGQERVFCAEAEAADCSRGDLTYEGLFETGSGPQPIRSTTIIVDDFTLIFRNEAALPGGQYVFLNQQMNVLAKDAATGRKIRSRNFSGFGLSFAEPNSNPPVVDGIQQDSFYREEAKNKVEFYADLKTRRTDSNIDENFKRCELPDETTPNVETCDEFYDLFPTPPVESICFPETEK